MLTDAEHTAILAHGHSAAFKDAYDGTATPNPHDPNAAPAEWRAWQDGYEQGYVDGVEMIRDHLRNLLARIHCDGGHYTAKHGISKSCLDADALIVERSTRIHVLTEGVRMLNNLHLKHWPAGLECADAHARTTFDILHRLVPGLTR
jgi:hypothetical protein